MLYSTTLPLLLFSSFILTSSLLACSSLSSAKTSEKANTRKMARVIACGQADVICRRLSSNRNHHAPLASTQRSNVCACAHVVITLWSAVKNELHIASYSRESICLATVVLFRKPLKQKGESTGYPYLNKLRVRKLSSFLFPYFYFLLQITMHVSIFFRLFCETGAVSYVFLRNFARENGARPARIEPLAHTRRLTAVWPASCFSHTHYFTHLHLLRA